jgi:hypothetical protein
MLASAPLSAGAVLVWSAARPEREAATCTAAELLGTHGVVLHEQEDLQEADFVVGSRLCVLVVSPQQALSAELGELIDRLCARYPACAVVVQQRPGGTGPEMAADPALSRAVAQLHELVNVSVMLCACALTAARAVAALAQHEQADGVGLRALGLTDARLGPHSERLVRFLTTNPAMSLVAARRVLHVSQGLTLAQVFKQALGKAQALVSAVPGLEMRIAGIAWAYFQRS